MPPHAWHTLGTDLFYRNKIDHLVIRDYFSKYMIIRRLPNSSSHMVMKELGLVFTELGRPFVLRSDNGPIVAVNLITSNISVSSSEIDLICGESAKDPTLTLLRHYIHMGWPIDRRMLPCELHTF